jgi:PIN domain nuclease of toxin-antitoxin system
MGYRCEGVIVLDTHVWLWWVAAPERLSRTAKQTIERAPRIGVSTLSAWEIAMLVVRGRISLDRDVSLWVRQALADERVEALAPNADVAVAAGLLDARDFPGDPIDRLLYATSRSTGATLVTRDAAIRAFDSASTLW